MGDIADLKPASLADNHEFVADMCRFAENILTESQVKKKWRFDTATWEKLGEDDSLVELIEAESVRRMRDGSTKKEKAQLHVMKAPDVLGAIMNAGGDVSPRHKIDAVRTLDTMAANGPGNPAPAAGDRFVITINLGADTDGKEIVQRFSKSIKIDPDDRDPFNDPDITIDTGDNSVLAAIAMKKSTGGGSGQPV